ncbi:MAG: hypothetical protein WC716_12430 [Chitinophagaceae bacterium]|jgi:hypothetical protein
MASIFLKVQHRRKLAFVLMNILILELISPNIAMALSSGPVQPEISSFEPVGTTDMVDLFTGDFVYNIPLMDVEGYPLNISYHGGVTMDQEASWVGLGWNINPGSINRAVRGLPDEFDGEMIEKELNIKDEVTKKIGLGAGAELGGTGDPKIRIGVNLGGYLNLSNYRGVSVDLTASAGVNTKFLMISPGLNVGATIGSQSGASINYNAQVGVGITQSINKDLGASGNFNINASGVYSPRTNLRRNVGKGISMTASHSSGSSATFSTGTSVPIGLQNHTAAITNSYYMNSYSGQLKLGGELWSIFGNAKVSGSLSKIRFDPNGSKSGFGYFNLDKSSEDDLLDFSREKDGLYNTNLRYLPQAHLTYDVYSVSGQGTGGSFRPFRNDIGSVFDPKMKTEQKEESGMIEAGLGNLFSLGVEAAPTFSKSESGPWSNYKILFAPKSSIGDFENVYFKEAGELTESNSYFVGAYANNTAIEPNAVPFSKTASNVRVVRANHIYTVSGEDKDTSLLTSTKSIISYTDTTGFLTYPNIKKDTIARVTKGTTDLLRRKSNHVTEIVQNQKDGRRYVYGLPVLNNVQREVTFAVDPLSGSNPLDIDKYQIGYQDGIDDSKSNVKGLDHFYTSTVTPTYVSAHLLTSVLSADYSDVTGDGLSDDDLGTYTKFNYSRKSTDYRWRSPIQSDKAQYIPNNNSDKRDDKAAYMIGSREQWMMHSIETKNYVAEFFVSERNDARGVLNKILNGGLSNSYKQPPYDSYGTEKDNKSYKLDSIVLYNKHDRFINGAGAQSIKTVIFSYDYSLCKNVPNAVSGSGKLTLNKIQIKYGNSNLNMSAAYSFKYSNNNPDYNEAAKDRWGVYKPNNAAFNNFEFPFTEQSANSDAYANAWSLTEIGLPSGGIIKVDYEADDYAYVQEKEAMEMFKIAGFGNTASYYGGNMLYFSSSSPNLYLYFDRRKSSENKQLSFRDNYFKNNKLLYYNVPVQLMDGKFENIKGYADVIQIDSCSDGIHGFIKMAYKKLEKSSARVNPIVYSALNVGRYSLPHILFPGADPDATDVDNIVAGMKNAAEELFGIMKNPLENMMDKKGKCRYANNNKAFIRLTSPGLKKKGGGQRVKSIKFYDSWNAMAGGNDAVYGKNYDYTLKRDDGKGVISSGVASYEPMIGGDEIPYRLPVPYMVQEGNSFPPNDPIDLYQELPIGESFYPAPVVGYSRIRISSINVDKGRSSQSEDISEFFTAKDYPIQTEATPIKHMKSTPKNSLTQVEREQEATQGFSILLNDMHGKLKNSEHWMLKPAAGTPARELITAQTYEYFTKDGELSNDIPVYEHNPNLGKLKATTKKLGIETDITLDSRMRNDETKTTNISGNLNVFLVGILPLGFPLIYGFPITTKFAFRCATATKVTQQYGILSKVTNHNQGAITEVRNEMFDQQTGNAIVTSVNNEFNDRSYSASFPAHWAYKEFGQSYINHELKGKFKNDLLVDTMGAWFGDHFVNYNPSFSSRYALPDTMPVARILIDNEMGDFRLGDEMLISHPSFPQPIRTWTMGYTSDFDHCYLILATREPYKLSAIWDLKKKYSNVYYRVIRSGNRNRLGETIQTFTTADASNLFPEVKNDLTNLISLNAQTYKYNLNQVYAANQTSDSLNPFLTGKVGIYRPEKQIVNLKKRDYNSNGASRTAGLYASKSYWPTEIDRFGSYCPDSTVCIDCGIADKFICPNIIDTLKLSFIGKDSYGNDSIQVDFKPFPNTECSNPEFQISGYIGAYPPGIPYGVSDPVFSFYNNNRNSFVFKYPIRSFKIYYTNGCCNAVFNVDFDGTNFSITNNYYVFSGTSTPVTASNTYINSPSFVLAPAFLIKTPYRVRRKIMIGKVGHYDRTDNENWVNTQQVTKYNSFGQELENKEEGIGYNAAVYGYNQQLPICVAKNARHNEVLFDGFEDYALLQPKPNMYEQYMRLQYSPFFPFFSLNTDLSAQFKVNTLNSFSGSVQIGKSEAHTGFYSLKAISPILVPLEPNDSTFAKGYSFGMSAARKYVVSLWVKPSAGSSGLLSSYSPTISVVADSVLVGPYTGRITKTLVSKSSIIEGWQKFEATIEIPSGYKKFNLQLGAGFYYDDVRIFPFESNSKAFVYHPVSRKLMATLDENNYATFYEYDAEGNLVRTKKETEKGILTITESRSTHRKN